MKDKIIITSGRKYIDIDAYGGIFAYKALLKTMGYDVYAVTTAYLNESISDEIIELGFKFDTDVEIDGNTKFIVLDVSNPDFIDIFVNEDRIIEIIDHHVGFAEYWNERKIKNDIEFIGSICTIIFEKIIDFHKEEILTQEICKILIAGILDNTLNMNSEITSKRDIDAYNKLLEIGKIDDSWRNTYFNSCYKNIYENLEMSILNDLKIERTSKILPEVFGQLIVLDISVIIDNYDKVENVFNKYDNWIFNVISLKDGRSYIFYSNVVVKDNLLRLFNGEEKEHFICIEKCLLRKEIKQRAKEYDVDNS